MVANFVKLVYADLLEREGGIIYGTRSRKKWMGFGFAYIGRRCLGQFHQPVDKQRLMAVMVKFRPEFWFCRPDTAEFGRLGSDIWPYD